MSRGSVAGWCSVDKYRVAQSVLCASGKAACVRPSPFGPAAIHRASSVGSVTVPEGSRSESGALMGVGPGRCGILHTDFREVIVSADRRAGHRCPYRASSRSKHTSQATSPSTAWKRSSGSFVNRDQHPIAVPPLSIKPHTYPPPPRVLVGVTHSRRREGPYLNL